MPDSNPGSQFQDIWKSALTKYKQDTERDYFDASLGADTPDTLFQLLDDELKSFKQYQKKQNKVRAAIQPVLELAIVSSKTIGESLVTASPPAKAVSVAIRALLKAAVEVRDTEAGAGAGATAGATAGVTETSEVIAGLDRKEMVASA